MIFCRPQYTPLPSPGRRPRCSWQALVVVVVVIVLLATGLAHRALFPPPLYSSLTDYQQFDPSLLVPDIDTAVPRQRAIVTTLYTDSYAIGAAVLLHSIKSHNTSASHFFLAYLPGRISDEALCVVRAAGWEPIPVPFIPPPHAGKGIHHSFVDQYTKLNIWSLPASRAIYLDADTLVRRNFDELFHLPWAFAAVPDIYTDARGFTIQFNAGVMAYTPDDGVLDRMKAVLATARYPPEEAEQAFLNTFFAASAARLPYAYNANLAIKTVSPEMWRAMDDAGEMRVVHYTLVKPFVDERDRSGKMLRDPERVRQVLDEAQAKRGGVFAQEVGWWREAYEDMIRGQAGEDFDKCRRAALVM